MIYVVWGQVAAEAKLSAMVKTFQKKSLVELA